MNRYKKLLRNTGLITLGTFGSKLLPFLLMRLYTAALSDGDYNTADLVTQTAKLLIPFAALGLTEGLFRLAMEENRSLKKKIFTAGFLIFGGGFLLLVPLLLVAYLLLRGYNISFSRYIFLIGLYVLASCLHSLVTQYIRTKDHFFFFSLQGVINTVLVALFNIVFYALGHFGVEEYVLSVALADLATFLLVFLKERLWRDLVPWRKIEKEVYSVMIRYSAPLIPMAASWWITAVSDRYMVRLFVADPNIADYYSAAYKIPTLVTLLCSIFSQAWSYSSVKENDEKERSRFFSKVFSTYFGLLFLMASFLIAFSKVLTALMMAKSYRPAWEYIPVLTGATVFSSLVTFMGSVYTVRMKSTFSMWTSLVGALLNVVLNLLLIPEHIGSVKMAGMGAMGAAVATLISYFAVFLIRALTAKHYVRFNLHSFLLGENCILLTLQILAMTFSDRISPFLWIPLQVIFVGLFLLLDGRILYKRLKVFLFPKSNEKKV